ncbi:MAG: hypothetical protein E7530_04450 [Ruminococcaceae bacterium]|nr:hypothetical protein [Oscillospiraceae bacterium]
MDNRNNTSGQHGEQYNQPPQRPQQPGGYYNQPQQRPQQPGGYYNQPPQRPQQQGVYYNQPPQRPQQPGGYYNQPQRPQQPGGYYNQPPQRPQQPGVYYNQPPQRPVQPMGQYNQPPQRPQQPTQKPLQGARPVSNSVAPNKKEEIKKAKKAAKTEKKSQKAKEGKSNKKGVIVAIALLLVVAIVSGIIGVVALVLSDDGRDYVATSNSAVDTGAVADVTFKDNVKIISDTEKVQEDFQEVTIKGEEYTITYGSTLPSELTSLNQGEIFCVPSIKDAEATCFEMGFCGELVSTTTNSITFKVPSMENVFSDFSFKLEGDIADNAEFTPASGVSVVTHNPIVKSNFQTLSVGAPNIPLSNYVEYDSEVKIGDYTIEPEFSYINPTQQSVLPGYSMFCDSLKLKLSIEKEVNGVKSKAISGTIDLEDMATKMDIEWHEDEDGNQIVENFDVGFMANVKSQIKYTDKISVGLDDLPKASEANDIPSKIEKVLQIQDVTDNEKGKLVLGSYVIGYNVKLPGLVNADNKIGYLSAGVVIQFFVSASGELTAECSLSNSGFYRAEFNSETGFSGDAKSYDYPSPALYTGEYTQEWQDSKPNTTIEFKGQLKLNASTGVDVGLCILGMVPIKIANNLAEVEVVFSGSGKKQIVDLSDADNSFMFDYSESVMAKSNSTLKIYLGAKLKMPIEMTLASFGFEHVLFDKVWYQYPDPIPFDHSQCGFGDIFVGNSYTAEEMDVIYKAFEKEHDIDSVLSDFKDGVGNAVVDTFKYELNSILSQADIDLYDDMYGSVKYYSSGSLYFLDENNTVVMTIVTGEGVCNAGGLKTGTTPEDAEKIYSAPDYSTTIKLDISEEVRGILREFGLDLGGVENQDLTVYTYIAEDTGDEMTLLYSGNKLKAIIVADM